ncbi:MAG TPA: class I SAM-dependent methyltransferase [Planctomycetota bacterium]|nr:class I SAM-dependent methyltransferase [Planctomycetota bacterium]
MADEDFFTRELALHESAYLATDDPRAQSGFRGDAARWERARRVIARAIDEDGAFLDVGCANGLLLESLVAWTALDGRRIEPFGLDISERLAALARARVGAERIFVGNALTWRPPRRFDFVRTELVYVPEARRAEYLTRLLRDVVAPDGRLIVCSYGSATRPTPKAERVSELVRPLEVAGEAESADTNGVVFTRIGWIDQRGRRSRAP